MSENVAQDANYNPYAGGQPAAQTPATPGAVPARPKTVDLAFWLLMAAAALVLIRIPVGIAAVNSDEYKSDLVDMLGDHVNVPAFVASEASSYIWAGVITALILAVIALLSRIGHGWARIVLIVVVVFTALNVRVQFFPTFVPVYSAAWLTLASVLLSLVATVLLFLAPSGAWFKSMGQYRKGNKPVQA